MFDTATIGLIVTVLLAFTGFAAKYFNDLRIEKKKAQIKLTSDQIQYLYGPLNALASANAAAWRTFYEKYFSDRLAVFGEKPLSNEQLALWRQWMTEVFMPMNRAMVDCIMLNTHLIDGSIFPDEFSDLVSHVKTYEIVLGDWAKGNFAEHTAFSNYPRSINEYASQKFRDLKARQVKLLY